MDKNSEAYQKHKARMAKRMAEKSEEARDIGPLPAVVDPARREACGKSLKLFCESYAAETFNLAWSPDHLRVIEKLERVILEGGLFALAMPRGSGKTSLVTWASLWALFYGYRRFVVVIGATADAATKLLETIKSIIETAEELGQDFPDPCFPIRCLEGINQRTAGQTCQGERTRIRWTGKQLTFPTLPGSPSSGAAFQTVGITGAIRGMQVRTAEGEIVRPDLALPDDPQTDSSAISLSETARRERAIKSAILGLAGPRKKIACCIPCTVIAPDDLADRLLDRQQSPDWQGEKLTLLRAMPERMDLWAQYKDIRADSLREHGDIRVATEFYRSNQAAMDAGCVASWPERFEPGQISAIQYGMDLWAKDEHCFWSEYQQQPKRDELGGAGALNATQVAGRITGMGRGQVPGWADYITAGIDVQQDVLFWLVTAWRRDLRGQVIDYGTWPDQNKAYFTLRDLRQTLSQKYEAATKAYAIAAGVAALARWLLEREYDGRLIDLVLCDANWEPSTDTIYEVARTTGHRFLPHHGRYIGAATLPLDSWKREPGDREGPGWRMAFGKRRQKHIFSDVNYWKSRVADLLRSPDQEAGLWLFGSRPEEHRMWADHFAAEFPTKVEGRGRTMDEWKARPGRDNHGWDCLIQSAVAASFLGGVAVGQAAPKRRQIVSYRQQQMARRA